MKSKSFFIYVFTLWAGIFTANAYDVEVNGIYYKISGTSASVTYKNTDYNSYSGEVVIPSSIFYNGETYPVTSIGTYAFQNCSSLSSVTIPESVTSILQQAFADCSSLTSITIPKSVTSIGQRAFDGCI